MKVLITGITGFVGRHLRKHLPEGHEYFTLVRRDDQDLGQGYRAIKGDLNDLSGLKGDLLEIRPDVCIHLAWEGIPDYGQEVSQRNLKNSTELFKFLVKEASCRKIVALGSCWEYGKKFGACAETGTLTPGSEFAAAKCAVCDFGVALGAQANIHFIWLRMFYLYGNGQRAGSLIPTLVRSVKSKEMPQIRTPLDANDYVHIDDAAKVIVKAVFEEIPSGVYNVGSGKSMPVWQVCEMVEKAMGKTNGFAKAMKASSVPASADFWADTSKTAKVLGWKAQTSLADGIKCYLNGLEEA